MSREGTGPADGAPPGPPTSLARTTFLALLADVATAVSAFAVAIVVARGLGPANRGIYFLAILAAMIIALIGNMGMATAAIVYGANQRVARSQIHGIAVCFGVVAGVLGAAALLAFEPLLVDSVLKGMDHATLILVAVSLGPLIYAQIVGALLTGMGEVPAISIMRIGLAVATPLVTIPAVILGGGEPVWPVAAWLATTFAFAGAIAWHTGRGLAPPAWPRLAAVREVVWFSLRGHVGTLAHQGFLRIDVLFVSAQLGPHSVGIYSQAAVLAERISTLGHAVYSSSAARLGSDPPDDAARLAADILRMLIIVMAPVAILLAVFSHLIMVVLFGDEFADSATPFVILLPGTVCLTLWYVLSLYITSTLHRPGQATIIQGLGFVLSVPLYWLAVERWGINGAAVVSTATYVGVCAAGVVSLLRSPAVGWSQLRPAAGDVRRMIGLVRHGLAGLPGSPARGR
jgi:O-antigen/teichoic acid export membrane protein